MASTFSTMLAQVEPRVNVGFSPGIPEASLSEALLSGCKTSRLKYNLLI